MMCWNYTYRGKAMSVDKLPKVIQVLRKQNKASPSKIATEIGSDRRTVGRILNVATNLGMIDCDKIEISGRTYQACQLSSDYKRLLEKRK